MPAWRRRALELFPSLRRDLNDPEYTIYMLYFDLLPMVREAHDEHDDETLRHIYGFAEWCFSQTAEDLYNAPGVAFYEHLFDQKRYWTKVVPWLSPKVIQECQQLWQARLEAAEMRDVEELIRDRKQHRYREFV